MSDFTKIYNFFYVKNPVKTIKRQAADWQKLFVNDIFNKVLVFRKYKGLSKLNIKEGCHHMVESEDSGSCFPEPQT